MQPQPQTIESTSNEASLDSLIQDHIDTVTSGFNPHAGPTMETSTEDQSQPTPPSISSPQLIASIAPPLTPPIKAQPPPIAKPDNWNQMSPKQKSNWLHRSKKRGGGV